MLIPEKNVFFSHKYILTMLILERKLSFMFFPLHYFLVVVFTFLTDCPPSRFLWTALQQLETRMMKKHFNCEWSIKKLRNTFSPHICRCVMLNVEYCLCFYRLCFYVVKTLFCESWLLIQLPQITQNYIELYFWERCYHITEMR